jgi:hypothetical protein
MWRSHHSLNRNSTPEMPPIGEPAAALLGCAMLSYQDIILLGEERVLVIQEHEQGRCSCGEI